MSLEKVNKYKEDKKNRRQILEREKKKKARAQLAHAFIHALSAYILLADWKNWIIPLVIFVSHLIIDVLKSRLHGKGTVSFLCDQLVHILVIILLWWWLYADKIQACGWLASMISSKPLRLAFIFSFLPPVFTSLT